SAAQVGSKSLGSAGRFRIRKIDTVPLVFHKATWRLSGAKDQPWTVLRSGIVLYDKGLRPSMSHTSRVPQGKFWVPMVTKVLSSGNMPLKPRLVAKLSSARIGGARRQANVCG